MSRVGGDRIRSLDVLRGWAVLGMLVVNVLYFSTPPGVRPVGVDAVAAVAVQLLAADKFWTLFSVLFGYGVALQHRCAAEQGRPFGPAFARRMVVLLGLGLVHTLLHPTEILHRYALLGLILIPLATASIRTITLVAGATLVIPAVVPPTSGAAFDAATVIGIYSQGSLVDVISLNVARFVSGAADVRVLTPLPYFLLGLVLGRRRFLLDPGRGAVLGRARWWALGLGLGLQLAPGLLALAPTEAAREALGAPVSALMRLGGGALGLGYAAVVLLWVDGDPSDRRGAWLEAVGRLALSNYLFQTLAVTTLLYGYGGGLYGRVGVVGSLGLAGLVFTVEVALSRWWLRRHRQGPVEWAWRRLAQATAPL